jgi:hypothetical protein
MVVVEEETLMKDLHNICSTLEHNSSSFVMIKTKEHG